MSEGLERLLSEIKQEQNDCFTKDDLVRVQQEISRINSYNEKLVAINHIIEQRRVILTRLDHEYGLSDTYPDLMREFAREQIRYMQLRDQVLADQ